MLQVFVYGTLKPGEVNYPAYCADKVESTTPAWVTGQLFDLSLGYPAMTQERGKVFGYLLTFADEVVLEHLDSLEGYHPQRPESENEYYRQAVAVTDTSGKSLGEAWAYFMTPEKVKQLQGVFIPSGEWRGV
jgi:gamma-glutamylcyclotransferase (GGCT)/AIG2-like uncharacterized protein YtfP